MGAARKAMDIMPAIKIIPTTILPSILYHLPCFASRNSWFWSGLDVRCNKVFQILKQLIKGVSSLDFVSETCVQEP